MGFRLTAARIRIQLQASATARELPKFNVYFIYILMYSYERAFMLFMMNMKMIKQLQLFIVFIDVINLCVWVSKELRAQMVLYFLLDDDEVTKFACNSIQEAFLLYIKILLYINT